MKSITRLSIDIGGTFTDLALEVSGRQFSHKLLTTPRAPARAVLDGARSILDEAGIRPDALSLIIHGTTLATNAIIERKGARTALLVTEGFRDSVEMAYENRFAQYDLGVERPKPLVPRYLRWPVSERMGPAGQVWAALDENSVRALLPKLEAEKVESVAIGFYMLTRILPPNGVQLRSYQRLGRIYRSVFLLRCVRKCENMNACPLPVRMRMYSR